MNNELAKTFTPINKQGYIDARFHDDLRVIFNEVRPEVIDGLIEFKEKTTDLEKKYASLASELCRAFIKRMKQIDETERDQETNQFRWRSKKLREQLIDGLKERGFKPSNVTKLVCSAEYLFHLESFQSKAHREILKFVKPLPISSQYLISGMSDEGVAKAMSYENDTKVWDSKTDTFPSKQLTVRALEEIKRRYPKNSEENRGRKKSFNPSNINILDDDPSIVTEVLVERSKEDMSQLELIDELVQIVCLIDTSKIYKDKDVIERLSVVSNDLWGVAHLARHPIPTT